MTDRMTFTSTGLHNFWTFLDIQRLLKNCLHQRPSAATLPFLLMKHRHFLANRGWKAHVVCRETHPFLKEWKQKNRKQAQKSFEKIHHPTHLHQDTLHGNNWTPTEGRIVLRQVQSENGTLMLAPRTQAVVVHRRVCWIFFPVQKDKCLDVCQ